MGRDTLVNTLPECVNEGATIVQDGCAKTRKVVVVAGPFGGQDIGVHNNTLRNGCRGLLERVLRYRAPDGTLEELPQVSADLERLGGFSRQLGGGAIATPWTVEEFLNSYTGRQRRLYEAASQSLLQTPICSKDASVGPSFVKAEKINFSQKDDPAPRIIQPRSPRYNLEVGVYLKRIEKKVYRDIGKIFGGPTVMKGYTAHGTADELRKMWDQFDNPVAVGLDASRFDQHVRSEMLEWEHAQYMRYFGRGDRRKLAWLLRQQLRNRGILRASDGIIRYLSNGGRMSGDMNTSLGNCLIMCALVFCLLSERGIRGRLANNGDDCVIVMDASDLAKLGDVKGFFLPFGFRMKVETPVRIFERVEFCSTQPVFDGTRWVMARKLDALSKDTVITDPSYGHGPGFRKWAMAVGECGLALAGGLPVYNSFYSMLVRHGEKGAGVAQSKAFAGGLSYAAVGMHRGARDPSDAARVSFWEAFGVTPTLQCQLEAGYDAAVMEVPRSQGKLNPANSSNRGVIIY